MLVDLMCEAGTTPYTQIIEPGTPTPTPQPTATTTPAPTATPTSEPTPTPAPTATPTSEQTPTPEPTATPTPDLSAPPDEVIFDPADPSSLGDLYPAIPGNEDVEVPQTSEVYLAINEHLIAPAAIGEVMIHVAEPVAANLQAIKERYLGDVIAIDADDAYYLLKVNMRAIELNQLEEKLLQLNTEITDPADMIRSVSIGNLESARTFALLVDLLTNEHIRGAELNTYWEPQSFSSYEGGGDLGTPGLGLPVASPRPFFVPNNVQNYWWLNEHSTRLNEAWHYNMGYNYTTDEPVQVAVIDGGFAGLSTLTSNGQDLAGRVRINQGFIDRQSFDYRALGRETWCFWCTDEPVSNDPVTFYTPALMAQENNLVCGGGITPAQCKLEFFSDYDFLSKHKDLINYPDAHGTQVIANLAAQISNGSGTAGASPYVDIIPIKVGSGLNAKLSELIHALRTIHDHPGLNKVSVINISMGPPPDINVTRAILAGRYTDGAYSRLNKAIYDLWNKKVITVFAAGNDSVDAKYNMNVLNPHSLVAGAVQLPPAGIHGAITPSLPHLPNPQALSRSVWDITSGSNWSPAAHAAFNVESIMTVYAPGSNMLSWQIPTRDLTGTGVIVPALTSSSGYKQAQAPFESTWRGTSASAPIVAGTVALMKGIKPDLSFAEARLALIDTAHQHTYIDNNLIEADGKPLARQITLRILNAEAAVKRIYEQNFVGSGRMQSFAGTLLSGGGKYRLQLSANPSQIYDLQWGPFATENAVNNTYQLRLPLSLGNNPPIRNFLNQPMQVQGHLRGSRLYVHQIQPDFGAAVPAAPTGVQFENIQTQSFRVVWIPSSQASSYEVHVNGSLYQSTSNTTLTVASRTPDTSYTVTIRALNSSGGASPFSTPAHVRTLALAPTPPPVCTSPVVDTVVTNTSWQWAGGGTYIVSNPWYTPQVPGAFPIWVSEGACTQCSYVIYRSYNLPQNWYVKQAYVDIQANQFANVMVRGRAVGQASSQSFSPPQRFNINPDHFGPGGNNLTLSFLAQNFTSPRPSVTARFTIERCPQ
ncbi:MAG: S8 family serine peptidase [Candidatus Sericytochromatia bacterium]|nr:S8 family serine peptidase [Candidatus Sericytochromatia bacterium]